MYKGRKPLKILASFLALVSLPLMAACGGGGGGTSPPPILPPPPAATFADGVFIDSAVEGLTYVSGTNAPGTTDANGSFRYEEGAVITFSVGGVEIGTLSDGAALVSPYDFGAQQAENIARFLQTLDADGIHLNGIDLTAAATALAGTTLDASIFDGDAAAFEAAIAPALETALGPGATLIDGALAIANLDMALDTTFELDEVAGLVYIVEIPSDADTGIVVFDALADPADTGSSLEMFMESDTLDAGGDGTTTQLDWSVDTDGVLTVTDPDDGESLELTRTGGSMGVISVDVSDGVDTLEALFWIPAGGSEMDLTGDNDRTYILDDTEGVAGLTFLDNGSSTRVLDQAVTGETWTLTAGTLITTQGSDLVVHKTILRDGNLVAGGSTLSFVATNLSGDPDNPELQLEALHAGSLAPVTLPDPLTAEPYTFSTGNSPTSQDATLGALFAGTSVSGSFNYANWLPPIAVLSGPGLPGATLYVGSLLDPSGFGQWNGIC